VKVFQVALILSVINSCLGIDVVTITSNDDRSFEGIIIDKSTETVSVLDLNGKHFVISLDNLSVQTREFLSGSYIPEKEVNAGRYELADAYYTGSGVRKDLKKSFEVLMLGAKDGNADCQLMVGFCYRDAEGVKGNSVKAAQWFQRAATQGQARAQANLGRAYLHGLGVGANSTYAKMWIERSAKQKDPYGLYLYGYYHYYGKKGIRKNVEEGINLLQQSANLGNKQAEELLTDIQVNRAKATARARSRSVYYTALYSIEENDVFTLSNGILFRKSDFKLSPMLLPYYGALNRPKALLYNSGDVNWSLYDNWNLWIEGYGTFKGEIISTSINSKPSSAESAKVWEVMTDGAVIKLFNDDLYRVVSNQFGVSLWLPPDDVIIIEDNLLINLETGDEVRVVEFIDYSYCYKLIERINELKIILK